MNDQNINFTDEIDLRLFFEEGDSLKENQVCISSRQASGILRIFDNHEEDYYDELLGIYWEEDEFVVAPNYCTNNECYKYNTTEANAFAMQLKRNFHEATITCHPWGIDVATYVY